MHSARSLFAVVLVQSIADEFVGIAVRFLLMFSPAAHVCVLICDVLLDGVQCARTKVYIVCVS